MSDYERFPLYIRNIIQRQEAGIKVEDSEIKSLMEYALELLKEFDALTLANIERLKADRRHTGAKNET